MQTNHTTFYPKTIARLIAIIVSSVSFYSFAIVPIDDKIIPEQGASGSLGININGQSGNKDEQEYSINALLRYRMDDNLFVFLSDYSYSKTNTEVDEDELFLHARWIGVNKISEGVDPELFIQYQYDDFADISSRKLVGGNLRLRTQYNSEQRNSQSILAAGLFYETETSELTGIVDQTTRVNLHGRYILEHSGEYPFVFSVSTYIQPAIDDIKDVRVLALGAIDYPIRENLSVGFEIEISHNSTPFIDIEKTDIEYGISLNYAF